MKNRNHLANVSELFLMFLMALCVSALAIAGPILFYRVFWLLVKAGQNSVSSETALCLLLIGLLIVVAATYRMIVHLLIHDDFLLDTAEKLCKVIGDRFRC